jgi:predicted RNA-binding protein associated with RNAse of E/G family
VRLWLWPDRPLRFYQFFDLSGDMTVYRVDFATYPYRHKQAIYQTDLYLDLFATPDERDYAILDEDELEIAQQRGLIDDRMCADILAHADRLVELLEAREFGTWLASYCNSPFDLTALGERPDWKFREVMPGEPDGWPEE